MAINYAKQKKVGRVGDYRLVKYFNFFLKFSRCYCKISVFKNQKRKVKILSKIKIPKHHFTLENAKVIPIVGCNF